MRGNIALVVLTIVILTVALIFGLLSIKNESKKNIYSPKNDLNITKKRSHDSNSLKDLSLPFNIEDISEENGVVNPLGVVRFSKDQVDIGHPGIDFPLYQNSPIYAVANGKIVLIDSAHDPWDGKEVVHLLEKTADGEGWAFGYEHIKPRDDLVKGTNIKRGEKIGSKIAPNEFTVHFQLKFHFSNYEFTKDPNCWPKLLNDEDKDELNTWWNNYKNSNGLINSWNTIIEENKYSFRDLLNDEQFSEGPLLCYPLGTDVR